MFIDHNISDRNKSFNSLLKGLLDFFKHDAVCMYKLLKTKGVSDREIAIALGVDRRVVGRKYAGLKGGSK